MQPQEYLRQTDFTAREGDNTDHTALNAEFDGVATSVNQIRENLDLIQKDDGTLETGIVTADSLAPSAFDSVQASVNAATVTATNAAEAATTAATTAIVAKDAAVVAKTSAETARDASALNASDASASAASALASKNAAATSETNALASKNAAAASQTAAAASQTSASNSAATATTQAGISTSKAGEAAASATASAASAATASNKAAESASSAADALASKNAAASSASAAASSASQAAASAASIDPAQLLRKSENLSGLTDQSAARSNLGLGSAAIKNSSEFATASQGALADSALQPSAIGVSLQAFDANTAKLNVVQAYSKAQRGAVTALTDGATITPDFSAANNFSVTLGGNRTLANPTNIVAGQSGVIAVSQDATGSRTLSFGGYWKFASGTAPTLTSTASAVDLIAYYCESATRIDARFIGDVK